MSWLFWLFVLVLLAAAAGSAYMAYRTYVTGDTSVNLKGWLFKPRPEPRLGVVEQATIDSRRRLVLIRRDDVEHLIMTGGPVDVVIEDRIRAPEAEPADEDRGRAVAARVRPSGRAVSAKPSTNEATDIFGVRIAVSSPRCCVALASLAPRLRKRRSPPRRNLQHPLPPDPLLPACARQGGAAVPSCRRRCAADDGHRGRREDHTAPDRARRGAGPAARRRREHPVRLRPTPPRRCARNSPPSDRRSRSWGPRPPRMRPRRRRRSPPSAPA